MSASIVAHDDASVVLQPAEQPFDAVALFVAPGVVVNGKPAVLA